MAQIIYHSLTLEHISLSLGLRLDLKAVKSGLLIATWWRLLKAYAYWKQMQGNLYSRWEPSSETQGQIVGARESLNRRKIWRKRQVKNGQKSPWGQCLTRPVPNGRRRSGFWSGTNQKPERRRPFGTSLVRHCPQELFSPFFTFVRALFFRPFRLSLAPTICPWVSEDGWEPDTLLGNNERFSRFYLPVYPYFTQVTYSKTIKFGKQILTIYGYAI